MHRVTLSSWHGGQPPGTELDVDDDELAALRRDGRIATASPYADGVVHDPGQTAAADGADAAEPTALPDSSADQAAEGEAASADDEQPKGRRRR